MSLRDKLIEYSKRALLVFFGIDKIEANNTNMASATLLFLKRENRTLTIMKKWQTIAFSNPILLNDELLDSEYPEFIEHRHDQSILSCLCHEYKIQLHPNEIEGTDVILRFRNFPILALRNHHRFSLKPNTLGGKLRKMRSLFRIR